jgi:hypothetical protein
MLAYEKYNYSGRAVHLCRLTPTRRTYIQTDRPMLLYYTSLKWHCYHLPGRTDHIPHTFLLGFDNYSKKDLHDTK